VTTFRTAGTHWNPIPQPLFATAEEDAAAAAAAAAGKPVGDGKGNEGDGFTFDATKAYEGLDADNLEWLGKNEALKTDPKALAKHAFNQEKLLGSAIRVPGKDATPEERAAFLDKLGRPPSADKYQVTVPEKMPEGLPYDGEFAKRAAATAHSLGLTQDQYAKLHDFFVAEQVEQFGKLSGAGQAKITERAAKATEELVKLYGPLDGPTAQANFEIADKLFTQTPGGAEVLAELKAAGLVGPNKEILSVPLAKMFVNLGTALYTENGVLRGDPDVLGNVFDKSSEAFNITEQMKLAKSDPAKALSLIHAAGKKPDDFGLPANFGA
jgi:hypothetical protein